MPKPSEGCAGPLFGAIRPRRARWPGVYRVLPASLSKAD